MYKIEKLEKLEKLLENLPSIGSKTAKRLAFYLFNQDLSYIKQLSKAILEIKELKKCKICNGLSDTNICNICSDENRDKTKLCIVADSKDIFSIENTNLYNGLYFVLGGLINPLQGKTQKDLNIKSLIYRLKNEEFNEIILALSPTVEGETTFMYLVNLFKKYNFNFKLTKLAWGLPVGSEIEYADSLTLYKALQHREEI